MKKSSGDKGGQMEKTENKLTPLNKSDPLSNINLSEEKQNELLIETFGEALIEKIPLFGGLIGYAQKYQDKIDAARLAILLSKFEERIGSLERFKEGLRNLLTSNAGLVLFNKTVRIVNAGNFEQEYIDILALVLKRITESDFEELFNEHDYVLSQIEKLSPQALVVLNDYDTWRSVALQGGTTMSGQTIVGDWDTQVTRFLVQQKKIEDSRKKTRIAHAFRELENNGIIRLSENKKVIPSPIGDEIHKYIS